MDASMDGQLVARCSALPSGRPERETIQGSQRSACPSSGRHHIPRWERVEALESKLVTVERSCATSSSNVNGCCALN